jgi:hypothetical protein
MRTRKVASERQNENSFIASSRTRHGRACAGHDGLNYFVFRSAQ